jgi:hypothetical protein
MTMRKLADPILNDLMLMVQARKTSDLSGAAITRYVQHLDRLDRELEAARVATGSIPAAVMDDVVTVPRRVLEEQRAELRRLADLNQEGVGIVAGAHALKLQIDRLADALFAHFAADIRPEDGTNPVDVAIALLSRLKEPTDESESQANAGDPTEHHARAAAPRGRAGATNRRA